jgi:hypothetical protein
MVGFGAELLDITEINQDELLQQYYLASYSTMQDVND